VKTILSASLFDDGFIHSAPILLGDLQYCRSTVSANWYQSGNFVNVD